MKIFLNILDKVKYLISVIQGYGFGGYKFSLNIEAKKSLSFFDKSKKLIIFDVGGNIGEYTDKILQLNKKAKITIFEPSKKNSKILSSKYKKKDNVNVEAFGLNNKNGHFKLYYDKSGSPLASLTKRSFLNLPIKVKGYDKVKFLKLENYIKSKKISKINILKIDIEGHELNCLIGAGKYINKIDLIQFEFGGCNIDTKTFFKDFWTFFEKNNFCIYRITPFYLIKLDGYSEDYENFLTTNYIAVNKKYLVSQSIMNRKN